MDYKLIISGGTFDHLHAGHKAFLRFGFHHGEKMLIGLTTDTYILENKKGQIVETFDVRKRELEKFLKEEGFLERTKIVPISNFFDETQVPREESTALLVSEETKSSGLKINEMRKKDALPEFTLLVMPLITSSLGGKISSTAIREGIIDKEGRLIPDKDFISKALSLSDNLREILHKPFGELFADEIPEKLLHAPEEIVTVGDATTKRFHDMGIRQKLSVIDFFVERKQVYSRLSELGFTGSEKEISVINPAGTIQPDAWNVLLDIMQQLHTQDTFVLQVAGEDDLFVIPLILVLPIGFFLFYGQPKKGVVFLEITEALKYQTYRLLKLFVAN